jgi:hypothetical protein
MNLSVTEYSEDFKSSIGTFLRLRPEYREAHEQKRSKIKSFKEFWVIIILNYRIMARL